MSILKMKLNLAFLSGSVLSFPIFITTNLEIFKGGLYSYVFSLPISFIFCSCMLFYGFFNFINSLKKSVSFIFLFLLVFFVINSLIVGEFKNPSLLALYLVFAFLGFYLPWCSRIQSDEQIISFFNGFIYSISTAAFLHLVSSFYTFGIQGAFVERGVDCIFGLFSIYQKFIYFSTLLAIASFLVMRQMRGIKKCIILGILLADIIMIGAREALVLVLFFYIINGIAVKKHFNIKIIYGFLYILFGLFFITIFYLLGHLYFPDTALIAKVGTLVQGGDRSGLSAGRFNAINNVLSTFDIDIPFLVFGSGFSVSVGDLATPHNQYIEWFLRGGVLYVMFSLYFLLYPAFKMLQSTRPPLVTIGYILLSVILISNNINTPFRAPYISLFLWALIGISFRSMAMEKAIFIQVRDPDFQFESRAEHI